MDRLAPLPILALAVVLAGAATAARDRPSDPPAVEPGSPAVVPSASADAAPESPVAAPGAATPAAGPLAAADRDTLLRLAWETLAGALTGHPIQTADLARFAIAGRLLEPGGCWVTLRSAGAVRGSMGEIEASRPLYQQVIQFTRRAATRDTRFAPLVESDLPGVTLEIAVIGLREPVTDPAALVPGGHGLFLEKWGRRAVFLPGVASVQGWDGPQALAALARQASLPEDGWRSGARIEIFEAEVVAGSRPISAAGRVTEE